MSSRRWDAERLSEWGLPSILSRGHPDVRRFREQSRNSAETAALPEGRQTRLLCRSGARAEGGFYAEPASRPGYQRAGSSAPWQPMIELPGLPVLLGCGPTLRASGSGGWWQNGG